MAVKQEIRFRRIKNIRDKEGNTKVILLEFQQKNHAGDFDAYMMECKEEAKPGFYKALAEIAPFIPELCELPANIAPRITVNGAAFSYKGETEVMGVKLLSTLGLKKGSGAMSLNTPYRMEKPVVVKEGDEEPEMEASESCLLPAGAVKAVKKLIAEAKDYMDGDRLQVAMKLPENGKKDGKAEAAGPDA